MGSMASVTRLLDALDTFWFAATWGDWVVVLIVFVAMAAIPTLIAWDWLTPVGPPDPVQEQAIAQALTDFSRHHARIAAFSTPAAKGLSRETLEKVVVPFPRRIAR